MGYKVNCKTELLSLRCTPEEKKSICSCAKKKGMSISEYSINAIMAGRERYKTKEEKRIRGMVELLECLNQMNKSMEKNNTNEDLKNEFEKVVKGVNKLWGC